MHFLIQACRRKPLESKWLSYSRGATAICMCCLFLAYVGYLISQLYNDTPLIVYSSEEIGPDYHTADISFCVPRSRLTINHCYYINRKYQPVPMENCSDYFVPEKYKDNQYCYWFMANDTFHMVSSEDEKDTKDESVRQIDFYWSIDNLKNFTKSGISVPTITMQLYDPQFSPRRNTIGDSPKELLVIDYLKGISQQPTSSVDQSSTIYYSPQKYYAIRPRSFRAFLGLEPDYIEINTLKLQEASWAISNLPPPKPFPKRESYQGQVSVALGQTQIDVQRETRQHTFLADVALAGGAYGILTTIYVLLFGMNKLTPWGLIHNTSSMINRVRYRKNEKNLDSNDLYNSDNEKSNKSAILSWIPTANGIALGTVLSNLNPMKNTNRRVSSEQQLFNTDEENPRLSEDGQPDLQHGGFSYRKSSSPSTISNRPISNVDQQNNNATITKRSSYLPAKDENQDEIDSQYFSAALRTEQRRSEKLESRVDELEVILSQFFIDITYLDELRSKEERKQLVEAKRKSTSTERNA